MDGLVSPVLGVPGWLAVDMRDSSGNSMEGLAAPSRRPTNQRKKRALSHTHLHSTKPVLPSSVLASFPVRTSGAASPSSPFVERNLPHTAGGHAGEGMLHWLASWFLGFRCPLVDHHACAAQSATTRCYHRFLDRFCCLLAHAEHGRLPETFYCRLPPHSPACLLPSLPDPDGDFKRKSTHGRHHSPVSCSIANGVEGSRRRLGKQNK
ncbi:hypothetical protein B0J18DRAFT_219890 [Chaetomium sp. MPI-SDFR-AT-0129]|nr:hypothetical protein B0J18DRAFT_219890 [Chaetomium sp. MPI-SDFR-AT-0129]